MLLAGSAMALWLHWEPWYRQSKLTRQYEQISFAAFSEDCDRVVWIDAHSAVHVSDAQTGVELSTHLARLADIHTEGVLAGRPIAVTAGPLFDFEGASAPWPEDASPKEEPWKVEFRARHPKPVTFDFADITLDDALNFLLGTMLKEKFVYNKELIDADKAQSKINLRVTNMDALQALGWIMRVAEVEAEFEDGAIHIVGKEAYEARVHEKIVNTVRIWDMETGKQIVALTGQASKITALALSPNATHVFAASEDGTARVWEIPGEKQVAAFSTGEARIVRAAVSNNGKRVAVEHEGARIGAWNTESGVKIFASAEFKAPDFITISPDGDRACFIDGATADLLDVATGASLRTRKSDDRGMTRITAVFSPTGDRLLVHYYYQATFLIDARDGEEIAQYDHDVCAGQFSADGARIAAIGNSNALILDAKSGKVLAELPRNPRSLEDVWTSIHGLFVETEQLTSAFAIGPPTSPLPQFSPDGKQVLALDRSPDLGLWRRRRPEYWWGVAWLPEFWLTAVFAVSLIWSVWRDKKRIGKSA